ncbi:MAG: hypothetical protein WC998_08700 [Candidatus Paceibacterota bacterium]|jgi:hypothetical protein
MTKQIRLKDGKVVKVERCGECLVKPAIIPGFCPLINKPIYAGHSIRDDCLLEEWQGPAASKEQDTTTADNPVMVDPATDKRWDQFRDNIVSMGRLITEKDAEIAKLQKENKQVFEWAWGRFVRQNQELADLGKALQEAKEKECSHYPCGLTMGVGDGSGQLFVHGNYESIKALQKLLLDRQSHEEPPKDEPELVICPNANQGSCWNKECFHSHPHKYDDTICNTLAICAWKSGKCIPVKKEQAVPEMQQPDPAVRYYPISEGELREAIKDDLPLSEEISKEIQKFLRKY